jgi:hypothetical protein
VADDVETAGERPEEVLDRTRAGVLATERRRFVHDELEVGCEDGRLGR